MADLFSSLIQGANVIGQTAVQLKAASVYNQDPRKVSWNTINALAATNPELAQQYAAIKQQYDADQAAKKTSKQQLKLAKLNVQAAQLQPAPATNNNTALIIGGIALVGLVIILTSKKGRK